MKIKTDKRDVLFSRLIRARDKCCVKCGKVDVRLECSHIFSRRHIATRWDLDNAKALCHHCHRYWWHSEPAEAGQWIKGYLGPEKLERLRIKAMTPTKVSKSEKEEIYQDLKQRFKALEADG